MSTVLGVDGRRGGWAAALVRIHDGAPLQVTFASMDGQDAAGLGRVLDLARVEAAGAVGIDCPIGLPATRWRQCDLLAKRRLGRAAARVFLVPPRGVLAAPSYPDARQVARQLLGCSVSAQAYGLRRIVLAVDDALRPSQEAMRHPWPVVEVHPELSFLALTGRGDGQPLPPKRTPAGRATRLAALAGWLGDSMLEQTPRGDDHLDALAVAWSAWRWTVGLAEVLGGELDGVGLPMRIVI